MLFLKIALFLLSVIIPFVTILFGTVSSSVCVNLRLVSDNQGCICVFTYGVPLPVSDSPFLSPPLSPSLLHLVVLAHYPSPPPLAPIFRKYSA